MKKKVVCAAVAALVMGPTIASAYEILGNKLEVYGKVHVSADYDNNDRAAPNSQKDFSFSSNASRIGFKGQYDLTSDMTLLWQIEQEINFDQGKDTWATRNTFAGLKGSYGTILGGIYDTPYKSLAGKWGLFGDTIGDRRAILGADALSGNKMNQRGKNALLYMNKFGPLKLNAMYSPDGGNSNPGGIDNNNKDMESVSLVYKQGPVFLGAAYEKWKDLSGYGRVKGWRVAGGYNFGAAKIGAIYEDITADSRASIDRKAWGLNGSVKISAKSDIRVQYMQAGDYQGVSNSGAKMASIGIFRKINKQAQIYAAYTQTKNDSNAKYQAVDGGHGDEVKTDLGGTPSAVSVGFMLKF